MTEAQIQGQCVEWFRLKYPELLMFSVPNEATYKRSSYFSSLGMLNGVSDTIVMLPEKILFVEFKTPKGKQRPEQEDFQRKVEGLGYSYYIIRSLEEFKELIYDAIGYNQTV